MVERAPKPPSLAVPLVDKDGRLNQEWYKYLTGGVKFSQNVNSGVALLAQQQAAADAALAAERAARIVNDAAVQAAAGGGAAMTSNAVAFSGGLSSGATWVTIATVTLTPTGAGGDGHPDHHPCDVDRQLHGPAAYGGADPGEQQRAIGYPARDTARIWNERDNGARPFRVNVCYVDGIKCGIRL